MICLIIGSCALIIGSCDAKSLWNGDKSRNVVALTFDDGPKPEYVQPILEILDKYGAKATFFVVGQEAEQNPDLIMRMEDSGNVVGNHTYSHIPAKDTTTKRYLGDVERCEEVLYKITKHRPEYFRPPGGGINLSISAGLKKLGLKSVFWKINANDYTDVTPGYEVPEDVQAMAKVLAKDIVDKVTPGTIILLHSSSEQTVRALPFILYGLRNKGYAFVTIKDMVEEKI
jgi:peptidoglycan-N-acetylglucosamine deacetylase